jgi:hypothetical protein
MLAKSLNLLTHPLWHTPTDKASAAAWAVSRGTGSGPHGTRDSAKSSYTHPVERRWRPSSKPGLRAFRVVSKLDATLQDTEDSQYHVGDDKYDYNNGCVLDEGGGNDPTAS